jgi:bla regulator protein BlaR1
MTQRVAQKLGRGRKLLIASFGAAAIAGPLAFGLMNAPQSQPSEASQKKLAFEVASIKPDKSGDQGIWIRDSHGRFSAHGITPIVLIQNAYDLRRFQITGGPSWINSDKFDIEAKAGDSEPDAGTSIEDQRQAYRKWQELRLQSLLEDRFQFRFHTITKEMPVYALMLDKSGAKIQVSKDPASKPMIQMRPGQLTARAITMPVLAANLSNLVSGVVLDRTGLTGAYDITLTWTPDRSELGPVEQEPKNMPPPDASGPSIFTAVQEQLGLKLKPEKGPVEIMVIDHVEQPSEN